MIEASPLADLRAQPERGERVDPAQAPQPGDRVRARRAERELGEVGLDLVAAGDQHIVGVQVVGQRRLGGMIGEPDRGQPGAVLARPRLARPLPVDLAAQQELPDPMPGAHQVHADVLAAAHQVAQLLTLHRRDRDQHELAGRQQPGQPDRVALIGLDPIRRRTLGLPRRAHPELDPLRQRPARQPIARRARLIDHPRRPLDPHRSHGNSSCGRPTTRFVITSPEA